MTHTKSGQVILSPENPRSRHVFHLTRKAGQKPATYAAAEMHFHLIQRWWFHSHSAVKIIYIATLVTSSRRPHERLGGLEMTPSPWCVKDTFGALRIIIKARRESIHPLPGQKSNPSDGRRELENCWRIDLFSLTFWPQLTCGTCCMKFPMKRISFFDGFPVLKGFEKRKRRLLKFLCPIFVILFISSFFFSPSYCILQKLPWFKRHPCWHSWICGPTCCCLITRAPCNFRSFFKARKGDKMHRCTSWRWGIETKGLYVELPKGRTKREYNEKSSNI